MIVGKKQSAPCLVQSRDATSGELTADKNFVVLAAQLFGIRFISSAAGTLHADTKVGILSSSFLTGTSDASYQFKAIDTGTQGDRSCHPKTLISRNRPDQWQQGIDPGMSPH